MKVLFLHGLESSPNGRKTKALKKAGFDVVAPALPAQNFDISVKITQDVIGYEKPDVIVGSSRGAAVAMASDTKDIRLVLVAPAWKKYCPNVKITPSTVFHSMNDEIVPFSDSLELCERRKGIRLIVCDDNHRMSSEDTIKKLIECIKTPIIRANSSHPMV